MDWWNLITTLVGAIIGAVVAGVISYIIARQSARETLALQKQERVDREKSKAHSLTVKMMRLTNSLAGFHSAIESSIREAERQIPDAPLWCKVRPVVGTEDTMLHLLPDELALFVAAREFDFMNRAIMLNDRYNSFVLGCRTYSAERTRLTDEFGAEMVGKFGTTHFTKEQYERVAPRVVVVDALANEIRSTLNELFAEAISLITKFTPIMRKYFGDQTFPELAILEPAKALASGQICPKAKA
ncbi:hypothetical protein [Rhizomicrobium electricum]|uniref:Uncharacterized protein n=1 Tax=Rhizomicrobium electricum TaxID=480070 RepID=A0ABN1F2F6_9PROT|nr:hypothetical protein [Rhizomicrobium electricum]NIJ49213.1 gas vesicle protein [Rhizomicrobium electricum]